MVQVFALRGVSRTAIASLLVATFILSGASTAIGETERLPVMRKGSQRQGPDARPYAGMATSRSELRDLWNHFNQRGDLPLIRFERNVAILASIGASGSCGAELHDLRLNRERKVVVVRLNQSDPGEGNGCTADVVLYTFTVAVSRADLKPLRPDELRVRRRFIDDPDPG